MHTLPKILFLLLCFEQLAAQDKYFIQFTDKNNSPYSIDRPEEYLSSKAIERRTNQGIELSITDLPVNPSYILQVVSTGAVINYSLKWINGLIVTITHPVQLETIQSFPFVLATKQVFVNNAKGSELILDDSPKLPKSAGVKGDVFNYGQSGNQVLMLNGNVLHNNGYQGQGMTIAVLDAGFYKVDEYSSFTTLWSENRLLGVKDFVNPASDIYTEHAHGMLVLSTIAGFIDGQLIGTAPKADFWLVRTEDGNQEQIIEEYNWAAGAEFADSIGADIINTSLGYTTFDVETQNHSYSDLNGQTTPIAIAAGMAAKKGMIIVVSAGNEGNSSWQYISSPADAPDILAVGSVNSLCSRSDFSSVGPSSDNRIKPEIAAMGEGTVVQSTTGGIGTASGTSLSAPVITGLIACLWQANRQLTAAQIRELILKSSSQYENPDNYMGYGLPDFASALNSITKESTVDGKLSISPNPFSDYLDLKIPDTKYDELYIKIFSITGQLIYQLNTFSTNGGVKISSLHSLPDGLYIVHIRNSKFSLTGKAIKKTSI